MDNFDALIDELDLRLFEKINSQTTADDKRSLLACQKAVRDLIPDYAYLEIGSYQGGSLQPYLLDDRCRKIYSIDRRSKAHADARGIDFVYTNNLEGVMLEKLEAAHGARVSKIQCFDGDASEFDPGQIAARPQLCFIDGEHTDEATWRDFQFCMKVVRENGALDFHDAMIVYNALCRVIEFLQDGGIPFRAYNLPDVVFVVEIGDFPLHRSESISSMLVDNYVGYLSSLRFNDQYRRFANRPVFKLIRGIKAKFTRENVAHE